MWNDIENFDWLSLDDLYEGLRKSEPEQPKQPAQPSVQQPKEHVTKFMGGVNNRIKDMSHADKMNHLENAHQHIKDATDAGHYTPEQAADLKGAVDDLRGKLAMQEYERQQKQPDPRLVVKTEPKKKVIHTISSMETGAGGPKTVVPLDKNTPQEKMGGGVDLGDDEESTEESPKKKMKSHLHIEEHTVPEHVTEQFPWRDPYYDEPEGEESETPGTHSKFGLTSKFAQHPMYREDGEHKSPNEITDDDLASMLHPHRFIHKDVWDELNKEGVEGLSEEQKEHLNNADPLQHIFRTNENGEPLYPNAIAKLHKKVEHFAKPLYIRAIRNLGLEPLGVNVSEVDNDPNFSKFVDYLMDTLRPRVRLDVNNFGFGTNHGGVDYFMNKWNELPKLGYKKPAMYYSGGLDYSRNRNGDDFHASVRNVTRGGKAMTWAERFFHNEADSGMGGMRGFRKYLGHPNVKAWLRAKKDLRQSKENVRKLAREAGVQMPGAVHIPDDEISVKNLKELAEQGGLEVTHDPKTNETFFYDPATEKEVTKWDGKNVEKLRGSLAKYFNPKAVDKGSPIARYSDLRKQLADVETEISRRKREYETGKQGVADFPVPGEHSVKAEEFGKNALSIGENLASQIQEPHFANMVKEASQAVTDAMQVTAIDEPDKADVQQLNAAHTKLKKVVHELDGIKTPENAEAIDKYIDEIRNMQIEIERYEGTMHKIGDPNQGYMKQANFHYDTYKNAEEKLEQLEQQSEPLRKELGELVEGNEELKKLKEAEDGLKQQELDVDEKAHAAALARAEFGNKFLSLDDHGISGQNAKSDSEKQEGSAAEQGLAAKHKADQKDKENKFDIYQPVLEDGSPNPNYIPEDVDFDVYSKDEKGNIKRDRNDYLKPDRDKEREVQKMSERMIDAWHRLKGSDKDAGELLFGGTNFKKGLVHYAQHLMDKVVETGKPQRILKDMMEESPESGSNPHPFIAENKSDPAVKEILKSKNKWKFLNRLYRHGPNKLAKFALMFSDYHPNPLAVDDFFPGMDEHDESITKPDGKPISKKERRENELDKLGHSTYVADPEKEKDALDFLAFLREADLHTDDEKGSSNWKHKDPDSDTFTPRDEYVDEEDGSTRYDMMPAFRKRPFRRYVFNLLRLTGNHLAKVMMAQDNQYKDMFQLMRILNAPHAAFGEKTAHATTTKLGKEMGEGEGDEGSEKYVPGTLRRRAERVLDYHYGKYHKQLPEGAAPSKKNWLELVRGNDTWDDVHGGAVAKDEDDERKRKHYFGKSIALMHCVPLQEDLRLVVWL